MDRTVIQERIKKIYNCGRRLERFSRLTLEQYAGDPDARDIVERNFQVAIQACLDIANYIIARKRFSVPEAEGNALAILGQEGVIPGELADRIKGMIGFRNILVHDYLAIDVASVHYLLTHNLGDFYAYCQAIIDFLGCEGE